MKQIAALKDAWVFLPAIPFFAIVYQNAPNIPIMDDYDAILSFLSEWKLSDWGQRLSLLFAQYNEHRLLYSRLVYVIYYSLFGNVNFRNLIFIADLQLVFIAAITVYFIRNCMQKQWQIVSFIAVLCIFDFNTYENGSIAMYGMQNYGVIFLFFLSLFLYNRGGKWIIGAALVQVLCIFSSGNGMIGALFIVLCMARSASQWARWVSIAVAAICIPLYFISYVFVSQPNKLPFDILTVVVYFIRMCGAHFSFDRSLLCGILLLIILILVFPYNKIRSDKKLWPVIGILGFLLLSMGTAAFFRACLKGAQFQTSRYLIYPQLLIVVIVLFAALKFEGTKFEPPVLIGSLLILLFSYSHNYEFGRLGFQYTTARAQKRRYWHPEGKKAALIAKAACDNGIYCLESER